MTENESDEPEKLKMHEREEIPGRRPETVVLSGGSGNEWIEYQWNLKNTTERQRERDDLAVDLFDKR
jgi:hypothetical protein